MEWSTFPAVSTTLILLPVLAQAPKAHVSPKNPQDHRSLKERVNFYPLASRLFRSEHGKGIDPIAAVYWRRHDWCMAKSTTHDLFSKISDKPSAQSALPPPPAEAIDHEPRLVLPKDLPNSIRRLENQELDRLVMVALAEQKRRGRSPPTSEENSRPRRGEVATAPLTLGKLNAVRAAFKAGVKPSRIAKQFGISQSELRKALAGHASAKSSKP